MEYISLGHLNWILLVIFIPSSAAWDPDAGLVVSLTKERPIQVTSNSDSAYKINDGQSNTFWQSGACLPKGFISRNDLNPILGACASGQCNATGDMQNLHVATDVSVYGAASITSTGEKAWFSVFLLPGRNSIRRIHLKAQFNNAAVLSVKTFASEDAVIVKHLSAADSYKDIVVINSYINVSYISISSDKDFKIFEIAALLSVPCFEMAIVDIGLNEVGVIRTRHWAGSNAAYSTELLVSNDTSHWIKIKDLDPDNLGEYITRLNYPITVKYIAVKHYINERNYQKCYVWEISAFDRFGVYGPYPTAVHNPVDLRSILGVNGIWGWQTGSYSDSLPSTKGTKLYSKICSHARNYHNMKWDVSQPTNIPDYQAMANGGGTEVQWWLNWDREYKVWSEDFDFVSAAVQFTDKPHDMPYEKWTDIYQNGYTFGYAYASHFGNATGTGHISLMEVGNEPWHYPSDFYPEVFLGMAKGAYDAKSDILIFPCALQAHDKHSQGNYIGHNFNETHSLYANGVNAHIYSFLKTESGKRISVHPEHPDSAFNEIKNTLRWRDVNVPNKQLWVTEWGWDSDGVNENCTNTECVTENQQAIYGVRGLLILARLGIEKATWFFYANTHNCNTLFCRSGLTGSKNTDFKKKKIFNAFDALLQLMGGYYFTGVIMEDDYAFVYRFGDVNKVDKFLVMWKPVQDYDEFASEISFVYNGGIPQQSWIVTGEGPNAEEVALPAVSDNVWTLSVSSKPTVVSLQ